MRLQEVANLAAYEFTRARMPAGWQLKFNRDSANAGMCAHKEQTIYLSVHFVLAYDESSVREIVIHEIAHALVGNQETTDHGSLWQEQVLALGGSPQKHAPTFDSKADLAFGRVAFLASLTMAMHIVFGPAPAALVASLSLVLIVWWIYRACAPVEKVYRLDL